VTLTTPLLGVVCHPYGMILYSLCVQSLTILASVIPEISSGSKNLSVSCDVNHTPFKGHLSSVCWTWNSLLVFKIWRSRDMVGAVDAHQNVNDLGVICHPWASTCYDQPVYLTWIPWSPLSTEIWKALQKWKMGWFGIVRGHWRSLKIAPFDRARTSSYQRFIVTMFLPCIVFEII